MARLPASEQEWTAELEETLQTVWQRVRSPEDADAFFADMQKMVPVPLEICVKLQIARAMAALSFCLRCNLDVDHAKALIERAEKIVRSARREVVVLQRQLQKNEKLLVEASGERRRQLEIQAWRECFPSWANLHGCLRRLRSLTGVDGPYPNDRLNTPFNALEDAAWIVHTPLEMADYPRAIAILNEVLANWAVATRSKSGQRPGDGAVTDFMRRVEAILLEATGLSSTALDSGVLSPIIDRMADALPTELNKYKPGMKWGMRWANPDRKGDSSTQRRVMRVRKRPRSHR